MQITSIIDIVNGKLLNTPSISFITQMHTDVNKVNEGDLFFAFNLNDIPSAIQNGAFAILLSKNIELSDNEIAWIDVPSLEDALIKLLRFTLSNKNITSYLCDSISIELLNIYSDMNTRILLTNDIKTDFEILKDLNNKTLFSTNEEYLNKLTSVSSVFIEDILPIENLTIHSLFYTSFSYKDKFYHKIKLPYIYINQFLFVSKLLNIDLDLSKLKFFQYFHPLFINKHLDIVDFGKTNKFILGNENKILAKEEISFLKKEYGYAKICIIDNVSETNNLLEIIKKEDFNALYIVGYSTNKIKMILDNHHRKELKLL